jgi:hypothetical protein
MKSLPSSMSVAAVILVCLTPLSSTNAEPITGARAKDLCARGDVGPLTPYGETAEETANKHVVFEWNCGTMVARDTKAAFARYVSPKWCDYGHLLNQMKKRCGSYDEAVAMFSRMAAKPLTDAEIIEFPTMASVNGPMVTMYGAGVDVFEVRGGKIVAHYDASPMKAIAFKDKSPERLPPWVPGSTRTADSQVAAAPAGPQGGGPMMGKSYRVNVHLQASSNLHKDWPGAASTRHYGMGYIEPFGAAEYYCGKDFPEEKNYPLDDGSKALFQKLTGRADALFCVYRTSEGSFYVYDSVTGQRTEAADGSQNDMINLVVAGTGAYKGATGLWTGLTEGRLSPPRAGGAGPNGPGAAMAGQGTGSPVLLKIMEGYVKLPLAR